MILNIMYVFVILCGFIIDDVLCGIGIIHRDASFTEIVVRQMEGYAGINGTQISIRDYVPNDNFSWPAYTLSTKDTELIIISSKFKDDVPLLGHELSHVKLYREGIDEYHEGKTFQCWERCLPVSYELNFNVCGWCE